MIKLTDALITDGLPSIISDQPRVKALAYAINQQMRKVLSFEDAARIYSGIMQCQESALDMMAQELRIPQYIDTLDIATKRAMVQNGIIYWARLGTVGALEMLCQDLFQSAECTEWFDYNGEPGHFRISTDNKKVVDSDVEYLKSVINNVKRLSAKLDGVDLILSTDPMQQDYYFNVFTDTTLNLKVDARLNK